MSIFKESFRKFVKQQLAVREKILSRGNDGDSRFESSVVDLSKDGGKRISLPGGAFYTNTVERQCVIRMSSGCDLTEYGAVHMREGGKYEQFSHMVGSGLARRYVLQGGTLAMDRETIQRSDVTYTNREEIRDEDDDLTGIKETTRRERKEKYRFKLANRVGFRGASSNDFGTAYGDPTIRANPADDYGTVPMPGILTANVRTKSAYGSLREAKVEFTCHNQRQLEVLELLYMRPGIPILLEWGWTPYINNKGKRITDFPFIGEWWITDGSMDTINREIIQQKAKTGGNYDALAGMCKNFSYKARPDGGFDCVTEIIAAGEIIETLKGIEIPTIQDLGGEKSRSGFGLKKKTSDIIELGLIDMMNFSHYQDANTIKINTPWGSYSFEKPAAVLALQEKYFGKDSNFIGEYLKHMALNTVTFGLYSFGQTIYDAAAGTEEGDYAKAIGSGFLFPPSPVGHMGEYFGLHLPGALTGYDGEDDTERLKNALADMQLYESSTYRDRGEFHIYSPYVRWDAFATFLNLHVINKDGNGNPLVTISTNSVVDEDHEQLVNPTEATLDQVNRPGMTGTTGPKVTPLLFSTISVGSGIPFLNEDEEYSKLTKFETKVAPFGLLNNYNSVFPLDAILNSSIDPSICLFPAQLAMSGTGGFNPFLYIGAVAVGFGAFGVTGLLGHNIYRNWAGKENMESTDRNNKMIGHIYLNLHRIWAIYKEQRYNNEGDLNDEWNLYDFIKKIWDDVSAASGNKHNFIIHNDPERPSVLRIIDANFQKDADLTKDKIHELKIQSNDTTCRDFSYNSVIPNELSATIAVAMQNPDSIQDIDGATFAALAKGIKSRFHSPEKKEIQQPTEEEIESALDLFKNLSQEAVDLGEAITAHIAKTMGGELQKVDEEDGEIKGEEEIAEMRGQLKRFYNVVNKLKTLHETDGEYQNGAKYYRGMKKLFHGDGHNTAPPASSVIPLKFNAKLDGIGGITIGNIFRIDPTRLPKAYKANDIGFVCMGEQQAMTAGQDWTTDIHGQLVLLPPDQPRTDQGKGEGDGMFRLTSDLFGATKSGTQGKGIEGGGESPDAAGGENKNDIKENSLNKVSDTKDQIDKQDQCPPGYYFDEELQLCIMETEVKVEDESMEEHWKKVADDIYPEWWKSIAQAVHNSQYVDFATEIFYYGGYKHIVLGVDAQTHQPLDFGSKGYSSYWDKTGQTNDATYPDVSFAFWHNAAAYAQRARSLAQNPNSAKLANYRSGGLLKFLFDKLEQEFEGKVLIDQVTGVKRFRTSIDKQGMMDYAMIICALGKEWVKPQWDLFYANVPTIPKQVKSSAAVAVSWREYRDFYGTWPFGQPIPEYKNINNFPADWRPYKESSNWLDEYKTINAGSRGIITIGKDY